MVLLSGWGIFKYLCKCVNVSLHAKKALVSSLAAPYKIRALIHFERPLMKVKWFYTRVCFIWRVSHYGIIYTQAWLWNCRGLLLLLNHKHLCSCPINWDPVCAAFWCSNSARQHTLVTFAGHKTAEMYSREPCKDTCSPEKKKIWVCHYFNLSCKDNSSRD